MGRCPACEEWDCLVEEVVDGGDPVPAGASPIALSDVETGRCDRIPTNVGELDRVLGGGLVPGSVILLAGEPGMGKSTLMLTIARRMEGKRVLYVAGEESPAQIRLRADRLGAATSSILVYAETDVARVQAACLAAEPDILVVDSIQSLFAAVVPGSPGSVIQTRACTHSLQRFAKRMELPTFIVGHVAKDGSIAGPKVLEHTVDTVLQFEGDRHHAFRILRAVKNRFGSCNEIGVFEMAGPGLTEVPNPSERFLSTRTRDVPGAVVVCVVEGTRPVLLEMQALVSDRSYGTPQRTVTGFDLRRLQMLLAVVARHARLRIADRDVFVNAVAGARVDEPAADAGVVVALASALLERPVPGDLVVVGEVGLAGELRSVGRLEQRLVEAARLGFRTAIVPAESRNLADTGLAVVSVESVGELLSAVGRMAPRGARQAGTALAERS